jgi:hypothetical protein
MKLIQAAGFIFSVFTTIQSADASIVYDAKRCDGCTRTEMENAAKAQGVGDRYVANLKDDVLGYYEVTNEHIDSGRSVTLATPETPDPDLVAYVHMASEFYTATNSTMIYRVKVTLPVAGASYRSNSYVPNDGKFHVQLPVAQSEDSPDSSVSKPSSDKRETFGGGITAKNAYDVVPDGPQRHSVEAWLQDMNNWPTGASMLFDLQAAIQIGKIIGGSSVTIQFEADFPDGSKVDVAYTSQNQQCNYVPGTAYDSHGNHLPDELSDLQDRTFTFDGQGIGPTKTVSANLSNGSVGQCRRAADFMDERARR